MATLHAALKALAPTTFADVPSNESELDSWLSDLFSQSQVILDSVPIAEPSTPPSDPRVSSTTIASSAAEITASPARPPPPRPDHLALQKEWGKPIKLGASNNPLEMSVYKLGGKDGRGAWFARRSVHEGLPFSHFKKALEMEFPESLAVQGAPGEGNVRGIGGETKHEHVKVTGKGQVEVYRLSAQFPGPTTPRDFVTLLVTGENAIRPAEEGERVPRHYIIVSKPCDHPETQPQSGFIRGFYESVEFIREIPQQLKTSHSASHLPLQATHADTISKDAIIRNAQLKTQSTATQQDLGSQEGATEFARKRSLTAPERSAALVDPEDSNPVEWIMVTRSDPGGSVPRFMVERGTPGSIVADAEKFLNWACQQDFDDEQTANTPNATKPVNERRESFRSSRMAGLEEQVEPAQTPLQPQVPRAKTEVVSNEQPAQTGFLGAVSGAATYLSSYTPQVVLNHLPGNGAAGPEESKEQFPLLEPDEDDNDDRDAASTASFESADSHLGPNESENASPSTPRAEALNKPDEPLTQHDKELRKLDQRRMTLQNKFSESRSRLEQDISAQTAKDQVATQKALEKHEKELKKQQEKYDKELKKIEEKQEKEKQKLEAKRRKQEDKDEKTKLTRERDEAREEVDLLKKEAAVLRNVVEQLQKENTGLAAKLGKASEVSGDNVSVPSRHSSQKKARSHGSSVSTSNKSQ